MAKHRNEERDDLDEYLEEQFQDPAFRLAYEDAEHRAGVLRELVAARREADLTQEAVADCMGTSQSAVSDLEGGVSDPRLSTLQRFARAVNRRLVVTVRDSAGAANGPFGLAVAGYATYADVASVEGGLVGGQSQVVGELGVYSAALGVGLSAEHVAYEIAGVGAIWQSQHPRLFPLDHRPLDAENDDPDSNLAIAS
jgi:transcriptional regulator with XRE-family HTH domain